MTDDEVLQQAGSAYAEYLAAQGYPLIMVEKIMSGEASTSATHLAMIKWVGLGIRAAKLSGGACEPVAWLYPEDLRALKSLPTHRAQLYAMHEDGMAPLYATAPAEPAVVPANVVQWSQVFDFVNGRAEVLKGQVPRQVFWALLDDMSQKLRGVRAIDPSATPPSSTGDMPPTVNLHEAYEREITAKGRGVPADAMGDIGSDAGGPQPAPGDDLVERSTYNEARARQYISVWGPDYVQSFLAALDARITAEAAVIAGKNAEIERLQQRERDLADECNRLTKIVDGTHYVVTAAEARITDLQAEVGRLRVHIATIHNKVRHELSAEIEAAADKAFKAMSGSTVLREAALNAGERDA